VDWKNINEVLVLAPHTDDGELGLGGTINKLVNLGKNVHYCAFSTAENSVPKGFPKTILKSEVKEATKVLGIKPQNLYILNYEVRKLNYSRQYILEDLIKLRNSNKFDLIFIPSLNDVHQDHSTIANEGVRAFKNSNIFSYELIWNNFEFKNQCFVELSKENIENKISSLKCYKSQGFRNYLSDEFIWSLAKVRGVQCSTDFAESFEIIRLYA